MPKTTQNELNSKTWKAKGEAALQKPFTNDPARIKHSFCYLFTVFMKKKKKNKSENSHNLHYLGL